jgi:hypothetical protein
MAIISRGGGVTLDGTPQLHHGFVEFVEGSIIFNDDIAQSSLFFNLQLVGLSTMQFAFVPTTFGSSL